MGRYVVARWKEYRLTSVEDFIIIPIGVYVSPKMEGFRWKLIRKI